jgi:nitroreductase
MSVFEVIQKRRSARAFKDTPIPDDILHVMLVAAQLAPSGGNAQGWCFGIVRDEDLKRQLAEAAGNQIWIATAPVVIACCADVTWDIAKQPADDFGVIVNRLRFGDALVDYMIAYPDWKACMTLFVNATPLVPAEHIFLTAVSHGLSACFVGYLDVKRAGEILGLPENLVCLFLLPVGYPSEEPGEKARKSLDEIAFYDRWAH